MVSVFLSFLFSYHSFWRSSLFTMVIHIRYLTDFICFSEITLLEFFVCFFQPGLLMLYACFGSFSQGFLFSVMLETSDLNTGERQKGFSPVFHLWFPASLIFPFVSALHWSKILFSSFLRMGAYYFWSFYVIFKSFWNICNFYLPLLF